ncbi:hypothetical protein GO755_26145 [Spirosoma sp. HMF4905]|uniref:Uncharacterized protein n=1 Tax=Spirosoma arboris TaxID=2682092 RepID=A0A7K1SJ00_9BACT|nr:hypothetical protein [Spirosoma arboris]MVM33546.1 hypothetical protein [Spirosoma arboris]
MSEYVLRVEDEPQAEALLTYLRSLNFVELIPNQASVQAKKEAIGGMKAFLKTLPNNDDYTQEDVNQALAEIRAGRNE